MYCLLSWNNPLFECEPVGSYQYSKYQAIRNYLDYPGVGIGGQCIPVDPFYLPWEAKEYANDIREFSALIIIEILQRTGTKISLFGPFGKKCVTVEVPSLHAAYFVQYEACGLHDHFNRSFQYFL